MSNTYNNLRQRLIELQNSRKDFLNLKSKKLKLINIPSASKTENETNIKNLLNEELLEIDQHIESLASIIETSINIGKSIICPVSEKEAILHNVQNTIDILESQKEIKVILNELEKEAIIENKIKIILKGNEIIKKNSNIFKEYHEEFLKKSRDVLSFLQTTYNSYKEKIIQNYNNKDKEKEKDKEEIKEKEKEIKEYIKEMEKNVILIYKLSSQKEFLFNFFQFLGDNIQQSICSIAFIEDIENKIKKIKQSRNNNNNEINNINNSNNNINNGNNNINNVNEEEDMKEELIKISNIIKNKLQKIFLKISHCIQERQHDYIILESQSVLNNNKNNNKNDNNQINNNTLNNTDLPLLYKLLSIVISTLEPYQIKLIKYLINIIEIMEKNPAIFTYDLICADSSFVISICEKFKFYITILNIKIEKYYDIQSDINSPVNNFLNNFNSILYDIGEKYCSNELLFMKNNIIKLFEDESVNYKDLLITSLDYNYDELSGNILNCIEDIFYIMKTSGERAISTLNLQIALGIINHIKVILNEDLYFLEDYKISTILIQEDDNNINTDNFKSMIKNINYYCKDEPTLTNKNIYGNIFLISCLDSIDQTKDNIPLLLDELKAIIDQNIIKSKIFDPSLIKLIQDKDNNEIIENDNDIKYFKSSELEMINFAFNDINIITNRYEEFIKRKLKLTFEHLYYKINSVIDVLNNTNYVISQSNINTIEMSETFSNKFISESEKYLNQWKNQLSEYIYSKFIEFYVEYATGYIEKVLKRKNYNNYGVILLQKDINKICNFLQSDLMINIREKFNRLFSFIKILSFESKNELEQHMQKYDDIILPQKDIEFILSLKV